MLSRSVFRCLDGCCRTDDACEECCILSEENVIVPYELEKTKHL